METIIGRCSLCSGDVVKATSPDAIWEEGTFRAPSRVARCRACVAIEAPPDKVIPMRKPPVKDLQADLQRAFGEQFAKQQQTRLQDAIANERYLQPAKHCPRCGPILLGGQLQQVLPGLAYSSYSQPLLPQAQLGGDIRHYYQPGQNSGIPQDPQNR
jgi:hypothetical protein